MIGVAICRVGMGFDLLSLCGQRVDACHNGLLLSAGRQRNFDSPQLLDTGREELDLRDDLMALRARAGDPLPRGSLPIALETKVAPLLWSSAAA